MTDPELLRKAFETVRREGFLPEKQRGFAREDRAIQIGYGQTNSQPSSVANTISSAEMRRIPST